MSIIVSDEVARSAATYLRAQDAKLAPIIAETGPCTVRPHREYYRELVDSIVSQQLSVKAAASIFKKFLALFGEAFPSPAEILEKSVDDLRGAGLSRPKARYIRDLAQHIIDGKVVFDDLDSLSNEDIIARMTDVKGIGEWTVHMFLIFCMGRTDVLAYGDLGVRNGVQKLYGLHSLPDKVAVEKIARQHHWHPYESIACWYVWRSLGNTPPL